MQIVTKPIPEISEEELAVRAAKIKVLVGRPGGNLWYVEQKNLRESLLLGQNRYFEAAVYEVAQITTYHTASPSGAVQPSIEEVLAQIPEEYLDVIQAVHLLPVATEAPGGDYHALTARLLKVPELRSQAA